MPLITIQHIARDSWTAEVGSLYSPRGFLPARALGVEPDSKEYEDQLDTILSNVADTLAENGIDISTSADLKHKALARNLARYYGAEAVLTVAQTGSVKDLEGNAVSLTSSDLAHWREMRDAALEDAERIMDEVAPKAKGGVWFASLEEKGDPENEYRKRYEGAPSLD